MIVQVVRDTATTVTFSLIGAAVLLALLVFFRLTRKDAPPWKRIRVGFFIEREKPDDEP